MHSVVIGYLRLKEVESESLIKIIVMLVACRVIGSKDEGL